jgi:hypothetical protein
MIASTAWRQACEGLSSPAAQRFSFKSASKNVWLRSVPRCAHSVARLQRLDLRALPLVQRHMLTVKHVVVRKR